MKERTEAITFFCVIIVRNANCYYQVYFLFSKLEVYVYVCTYIRIHIYSVFICVYLYA